MKTIPLFLKISVVTILVVTTTKLCAQWETLNSGIISDLNDVFFINSQVGFAVGDSAVILKTTNGGDNWTKSLLDVPDSRTIRKIHFVNDSVGYLLANGVAKTNDQGDTWNFLYVYFAAQAFMDVYFVDENVGYLVDIAGRIYKTIDGGFSWTFEAGIKEPIWACHFVDENIGYVVGGWGHDTNRVVSRTSDGGSTWETVIPNNDQGQYLDVFFTSASTGFIVENWGRVLKTVDSGKTWQESYNNNFASLRSICFNNKGIGFVGGSSIYRTPDNGSSWDWLTVGGINALYASSGDVIFGVGDNGKILRNKNASGISHSGYNRENITIYPNPVNENLFLDLTAYSAKEFNLKITDVLGQNIYFRNYTDYESQLILIDTSILRKGTYYVIIESKNTPHILRKILKL